MSWVSLNDVVRIIDSLMGNPSLYGPVNLVAPNPVTNREFTKALGQALHKPTFFPVPGWVLRLMFGEMAKDCLLASTRVVPQKLQQAGFQFEDPHLMDFLATQV